MAEDEAIFSSRVSTNMVTNIVRTLVMALAGLLMVPYYIDQFGIATYAIIPLATTMTNYFMVVSDSLSNAYSRYVSLAIGRGNREEINRVFTTSVYGMCRWIAFILPVTVVFSLASPIIFNVGGASGTSVQIMFLLVFVAALLTSFGTSLGSVYVAHNRMYVTYISRTVQTLSQVGVVIALIMMRGPSPEVIGISFLLAAVLMLAIMMLMLHRVDPDLRFRRSYFDRPLLKEMSSLGVWTVITELGSLMFLQASIIIVNITLGAYLQGRFSIVASLIMMIHTVCTSLAVVSLPLAYRNYSKGDTEGLIRLMMIYSKFIGLVMVLPLAYLMIFGDNVLEVWVGEEYRELHTLLYILLPVDVSLCASKAYMDLAIVYNKARPLAIATVVLGLLNILLALAFVEFTDLGMKGVCISWSVTILMLELVYRPIFCGSLVGDIKRLYIPVVETYIVFAVVCAILYLLSTVISLPISWMGIILPMFALFAIYFVLVMRFAFNNEERGEIVTFLPRSVQRLVGHKV